MACLKELASVLRCSSKELLKEPGMQVLCTVEDRVEDKWDLEDRLEDKGDVEDMISVEESAQCGLHCTDRVG